MTRLAGGDRYSTAVAVSRATVHEQGGDVFVVTGMAWPDALAAGPAAASRHAPVLPVARDQVPGSVLGELDRLRPRRAWVIGGHDAVGQPVVDLLRSRGIEPVRISASDRYATATAVARTFFASPGGAYYASGEHYADALAGGAAAASRGWPLLLTMRDRVPAGTRVVAGDRVVLGGPASIDDVVRAQLAARRIGGADRYATATAVALDAFPQADVAYLATGLNFPDALAGGAAAGRDRAPLLLAARDCVPAGTRDTFTAVGAEARVVLGGVAAVSDRAAALIVC